MRKRGYSVIDLEQVFDLGIAINSVKFEISCFDVVDLKKLCIEIITNQGLR